MRHRPGPRRAGRQWKAHSGIHGIIHRRFTAPCADQRHHHQIGPQRRQGGIIQRPRRAQVGQKAAGIRPRGGDQSGSQFLPFGPAKINRD